jgi:predicted CopG family antitoxin
MYLPHKKYSMSTSYKRRTITLKDEVYSRLSKEGKFNESFSQLVTRLLNELQNRRETYEN